MLVKAGLEVHFGPFNIQPGPTEAATNCRSLVTSSKLLRDRHTEHLTMACAGVSPKGPRNNMPSDQLQTTSEQNSTNFTNSISKWRLQQHLPSSSHSMVGVEAHIQPA